MAEKAGAEVRPLCQAERIERMEDGRYRVTYFRYQPAQGFKAVRLRWMTLRPRAERTEHTIIARRVVVAAGSVGSTELLLRNKNTLPELSPTLGQRYTTNGDFLTLIIPFRGLWLGWPGFFAMLGCAFAQEWIGLAAATALYYLGLLISPRAYDPDIGTTNSDHIRFKGPNGETQGVYIESGRYPTPGQTLAAIVISSFTDNFRPRLYRTMTRLGRIIGSIIPPFGALARTYPIPLLSMGRDKAFGTYRLEGERAVIDYDVQANKAFYAYLERSVVSSPRRQRLLAAQHPEALVGQARGTAQPGRRADGREQERRRRRSRRPRVRLCQPDGARRIDHPGVDRPQPGT